jgi:hypothetical protein
MNATKANMEIAQALAIEAKDVILNQEYKWKPLTDSYLARKIREGYDRRMLVRTQEYVDAISYGSVRGRVWFGVPPGIIHQDSGLPMYVLAKIHEFGTDTIPARQLWRPLLSRFMRQRKEFGDRYRKEIYKAMKRVK